MSHSFLVKLNIFNVLFIIPLLVCFSICNALLFSM
jgi:hypothetical protein